MGNTKPGHGGKRRFREQAITALLSGVSIEEAARQSNVTKMTLLRWMKDPEFRAAYQEAKLIMLRAATARLTKNAAAAAATLDEISEGKPEAHQGARVAAAHVTLRLALDAFELESLEERIRKLEEQSREV